MFAYEPKMNEGKGLLFEINNLYSIIRSYHPHCFNNPEAYLDSLDTILTGL